MTDQPADQPGSTDAPGASARKRSGGLSSMLLADLKSMAAGLGVKGAGSMKKAQLVEAIKAAQSGGQPGGQSRGDSKTDVDTGSRDTSSATAGAGPGGADDAAGQTRRRTRGGGRADSTTDTPAESTGESARESTGDGSSGSRGEDAGDSPQGSGDGRSGAQGQPRQQKDRSQVQQQGKPDKQDHQQDKQTRGDRQQGQQQGKQGQQNQQQDKQGQQNQPQDKQQDKRQGQQQNPQQNQQHQDADGDDDGEGGSRRNRRRRGRDRQTPRPGGRNEPDTTILEDDVLVPAAGILDVLENYAFVRTSGYLPGVDDVYLSLSMVRKFGLRRGDAVAGQVRQPREGERREKFNPMVRIDQVNGADPEGSRERADFDSLTPVHPTERLRLETAQDDLIGRMIDIAAPVGKGQRGLVVAPPKSGRTTMLASIARSISRNNPECHLMVVLLDARPEEVTDFQRSVKGEVIASTFDRPASDHTMVAELATERAKRLVELGHDVVVLLDSLTSLGRAYNLTAPANGRILPGGLDVGAVQPPKKIFGAARNVEGGGSLTMLATAVAETGSVIDETILEEFRGAANMELRLRRELAEAQTFPAIDVVESSTRQAALVTSEQEEAIVAGLRRSMSAEPVASVAAVLEDLAKSQNNIEFLTKRQSAARGR